MIGDKATKSIAESSEWQHVDYDSLQTPLLERFLSAYRLIATPIYAIPPIRGEMMRFAFARYFYALEYATRNNIDSFWFLDSDEIILEDLQCFASQLHEKGIHQTRMANNTALRGLMSREVVQEFCHFLVELFEDEENIQAREEEYGARTDDAAYSEMLAGYLFNKHQDKFSHLEKSVDGWHFDDCIMHEDDFQMINLGHIATLPVKHVKFDGQHFTGVRSGEKIKFATINGSGLPRQIFPWFLDCIRSRHTQKQLTTDIIAYQPSRLREIAYSIKQRLKKVTK
jgi:hypothetical protein